MPHAHVHVPHELAEPEEHHATVSRGERRYELAAVLLLSLTTLATAWSGYQAARWSGEQSSLYARASALRVQAYPIMAMAADTVIVTAEHIVPVGVIGPDHVVTPAPLVDYLITNG